MSQKINPNVGQRVNPRVNPKVSYHGIDGVGVQKKYGNADIGSANALYNQYKKWVKANKPEGTTPMPFKEWLKWAQDRGICNNFSADGTEPNIDYDFDEFRSEIRELNDDSLKSTAAEMKYAQEQNWGGVNLISLHGPTETFGITNQETLRKAIEVVDAEMKAREDVVKVTPQKTGIGGKIAASIGIALVVTFIIAAFANSGKGK